MRAWLVDTGPLVAYLDAADPEHDEVAACLDGFAGRLCTTNAVATEAMQLLQRHPQGPAALAQFAEAAPLEVYDAAQPDVLAACALLMDRYSDTPMDYADATLVLLADRVSVYEILTLDRRGFRTYRAARKRRFRLVLDDPS